jgi:hypothetical protein
VATQINLGSRCFYFGKAPATTSGRDRKYGKSRGEFYEREYLMLLSMCHESGTLDLAADQMTMGLIEDPCVEGILICIYLHLEGASVSTKNLTYNQLIEQDI